MYLITWIKWIYKKGHYVVKIKIRWVKLKLFLLIIELQGYWSICIYF